MAENVLACRYPEFYLVTLYPEDTKLAVTYGFLLDKPKKSWEKKYPLPVYSLPHLHLENKMLLLEHIPDIETWWKASNRTTQEDNQGTFLA